MSARIKYWVTGSMVNVLGTFGFGGYYLENTAADAARRALKEHPAGLTTLDVWHYDDLWSRDGNRRPAKACISLRGNPFISEHGGEGGSGEVLDENGAPISPDDWRWEYNHPWFTRKPWWKLWR